MAKMALLTGSAVVVLVVDGVTRIIDLPEVMSAELVRAVISDGHEPDQDGTNWETNRAGPMTVRLTGWTADDVRTLPPDTRARLLGLLIEQTQP